MEFSPVRGKPDGGRSPLADPPETAAAADVQPDPLLESGAFIAATVTGAVLEPEPTEESQNPDLRRSSSDDAAGTGVKTPVPERAAESTESPVGSRKRSRKRVSQNSSIKVASDASGWLPPGWIVEDRVRSSGATAGVIDKYYVDPASGRRFRSKKEVFRFLETGSKRQKKSKDDPDADDKPLGTPGGQKKKKSNSKVKKKSGR